MQPQFCQVNLVVGDMTPMVDFFRTVGLDVPDASSVGRGAGQHVGVPMTNGSYLQIDNDDMARIFHQRWRSNEPGSRVILGFLVDSRERVDAIYNAVVQAGYEGTQPPYDAYWGVRYAIVAAPSGIDVAIAGPTEPRARVRAGVALDRGRTQSASTSRSSSRSRWVPPPRAVDNGGAGR